MFNRVKHDQAEHKVELDVLKKLKLNKENFMDMMTMYHKERDADFSAKNESAMAPGIHPEPCKNDDKFKMAMPGVNHKIIFNDVVEK